MQESQQPAGQAPEPQAEATETAAEEGVTDATLGEAVREDLLDSALFGWLPDSARGFLEALSDHPLLLMLLVLGFGYLAGKALQFVLTQFLGRLSSKTASNYDDRLLAIARRPALTTPVILSLLLITALAPFPSGVQTFTVGALATVLLLSWVRAALKASHVLLELIASREGDHEVIQARTIPLFEITLKLLLVAVAGYLLLMIWGVDPTAWLASAGVIGIAVGFAAKDTLANLFSGIFIVADAPYKIGDYVVLDTGDRGEVTALGMRSTRLLTRDDVEITIPNAIIANAKIINESGGPWEKHRIRIAVGVAYGSDVDEVVDVLRSVADAHGDILDDPEPRVRLRAFGASSLDFELLGWIDRPVLRGRVSHELMMAVYKRLDEAGIGIPFPQTDVYIREMPGTANAGKAPD